MNTLVWIFVIVITMIIFNQKDSKYLKLSEKLFVVGILSWLIYCIIKFAFLLGELGKI